MNKIDLNHQENEVETLFKSGADKRQKGLYEESIEDFLKALEINPCHIASNYQISYSLRDLSRYQEALVYANKIIDISPDRIIYEQRAMIKKYLGDFEGANTDLNIALSIPKDDCWC